jgi:nicotinamide-nucleotide amidase
MNAIIIAVGSELLTPARIDTNSLFLTEKLNSLGVEVVQKMVVGDDRKRLEAAISFAQTSADLILLTGGLGPTEDDLTRECVAASTGRGLGLDKEILTALEARFQTIGRKMADNNKRQAYVLEGADVLPNHRGTAPGQWLMMPSRQVFILLPGPPGEMKPMIEQSVLPALRRLLPPLHIATLQFRLTGMGESDVDALIAPVYKQYENPVTTILAKAGDIQLHLRARSEDLAEAERLCKELGDQIQPLLGNKIYSTDGASLEEVIGRLLGERQQTIAVAESLTAGMLGARFAGVAGASRWFNGGFLTYNNAQKQSLLGVEPWTLTDHGEVSEAVALQMALGARNKTNSTYGVSLTGYAGPDGGTEANPVGTVYIGLAGPSGAKALRFRYPAGDRDRVRQFAVQGALNLVRLELIRPE